MNNLVLPSIEFKTSLLTSLSQRPKLQKVETITMPLALQDTAPGVLTSLEQLPESTGLKPKSKKNYGSLILIGAIALGFAVIGFSGEKEEQDVTSEE